MKTFVVGNWKMNFSVGEASIYLHKLLRALPNYRGVEVVVAPPMVALQALSLQVDRHKLKLAAQNGFWRDYGAFTGESSFAQLRSLADYALVGHSERRYILGESDKLIAKKVAAALRNKITPILCIGEIESERAFGETADAVRDQLLGGLSEVADDEVEKVIVAYEPVWAISSTQAAKMPTPEEIGEVVALIRENLRERYGAEIAEKVAVLYGGSVSVRNAGVYLSVPGVNGLLMGAASLRLKDFVGVIEAARLARANDAIDVDMSTKSVRIEKA